MMTKTAGSDREWKIGVLSSLVEFTDSRSDRTYCHVNDHDALYTLIAEFTTFFIHIEHIQSISKHLHSLSPADFGVFVPGRHVLLLLKAI